MPDTGRRMTARALRPLAALGALALALAPAGRAAPPGYGPEPELPAPDTGHDASKYVSVTGWPADAAPKAPDGFTVTRYATGLDSPRWLLPLPNGDVLVAEATTNLKPAKTEEDKRKQENQVRSGSAGTSANRVTLLRDADKDGTVDSRHVLLEGLNQPFGMAVVGRSLYVANTDGVVRYAYEVGQTKVEGKGEKILDLPAGGYNNHWTRNIMPNARGDGLLVTVGSASNVGEYGMETEARRAAILEVALDGSRERVLAEGLRNPNGMGFEPRTGRLWTVVNERDKLGDDLVPDYLTSVQEGGFYGWPYSYWGRNEDPCMAGKRPDLVKRAITPDYALGAHTASLGLAFYDREAFPERYRGGAFVSQRGSWNRSDFTGFKVVFVPFEDGKPGGPPQDFLTGFLADKEGGKAHGRPVGLALDATGALLVADDAGDTVWRVAPARGG